MPQLNPEFYISQLFWLILTFTFLFIFLWRISLPRISTVLEKRASKINNDIRLAKQHQAEAEEIQNKIDFQLREARLETSELIKTANFNFQDQTAKELEKIDNTINLKIDETSATITKSKAESLKQINDQIYEITKLTLSKISNIKADDNEIKDVVTSVHQGAIS
jgi:F-type H+-transporting ATPase subunit b